MHTRFMAVAVLAVGITASNSMAEIIEVCSDGCEFETITEAMAAASSGDTIRIASGIYEEGELSTSFVGELTLIGEVDEAGRPSTILNETHFSCANFILQLENLVFEGDSKPTVPSAPAVGLYEASAKITNCVFRNLDMTGNGAAIYCDSPSDEIGLVLEDCEFLDNNASGRGGAVFLSNGYDNTVEFKDCLFRGNTADEGGAIYMENYLPKKIGVPEASIWGSTFVENDAVTGSAIMTAYPITTITSSIFSRNGCVDVSEDEEASFPIDGDYTDAGGNEIDLSCEEPDPVPGDLDGDGDFDEDDVYAGMKIFGITEGTPGDMDGDGDADEVDWQLLGIELGVCLGDINGDGKVDGGDLGLLIGAWGFCP